MTFPSIFKQKNQEYAQKRKQKRKVPPRRKAESDSRLASILKVRERKPLVFMTQELQQNVQRRASQAELEIKQAQMKADELKHTVE